MKTTAEEKNHKSVHTYAENFLRANGFEWKPVNIGLCNDKCEVIVHKGNYEIITDEGQYFTPDHLIYHLIGYLTYYNLMDKNYLKP